MKNFLCLSWILLICFLGIAAEVSHQKLSFQVSERETFEVVPKPGWKMIYPVHEFGMDNNNNVAFLGPHDTFNLTLTFYCVTKDSAKYDTEEKMKQEFMRFAGIYYDKSLEKQNKIRAHVRRFMPSGRLGCVVRFTDPEYAENKSPVGEQKYWTIGMFRLGQDSVLTFFLATNSIDDRAYCDLLNYIAAFAIPEKGKKGWKAATAIDAYKIAEWEFDKHYPVKLLNKQKPYSVILEKDKWIVWGSPWSPSFDGIVKAEIDGVTGKVLSIASGIKTHPMK